MNRDDSGVFYVMKEHSQILLYCVIQLKSQALSVEFYEPVRTPAPGSSGPALPATLKTQLKLMLAEEGIRADPIGTRTEDEEIEATLTAFTIPMDPSIRVRISKEP